MGSIAVSNLGKAYKQYPSHWARLMEWLVPADSPRHQLHWVLRDVSFVVSPGEAVGIIGMNGAGKSTLLKMITGTSEPTMGSVHVQGRLAALLELGMGFHPDFTGRQNVLMAGQLMGFSFREITELMPEIEAFAEIGEYIDQPVRVYSSGMQVRLAFSVATARRPEILIVDEALSVGDSYFQHKSFARIKEFGDHGTTLLFVSHSPSAIKAICDRAMLLRRGQMIMEGEPEAVLDYYNALLAEQQTQTVRKETIERGKVRTVSGTGEAKILTVLLKNEHGDKLETVRVGQPVILEVCLTCEFELPELVVGFLVKDKLGQEVFGTNTYHLDCGPSGARVGEELSCSFSFNANFGPGTYSVSVALHTKDTHLERNYEWRDLALVFDVVNADKPLFAGCVWLPVNASLRRLSTSEN